MGITTECIPMVYLVSIKCLGSQSHPKLKCMFKRSVLLLNLIESVFTCGKENNRFDLEQHITREINQTKLKKTTKQQQ